MRASVFPLFLSLLIPPAALSAQQWSSEEQELLDHVKVCWDAWADAVNAKDLDIWMDTCQPDPDFSGWWTSDGGLWTLEAEERGFSDWVAGVEHMYWENLQPLEIKVHGDIGMIWFYITYREPGSDGPLTRFENKRFEVFRRAGGVWHWLGAMVQNRPMSGFEG
jgi:ketosteroid isomerase-like protein